MALNALTKRVSVSALYCLWLSPLSIIRLWAFWDCGRSIWALKLAWSRLFNTKPYLESLHWAYYIPGRKKRKVPQCDFGLDRNEDGNSDLVDITGKIYSVDMSHAASKKLDLVNAMLPLNDPCRHRLIATLKRSSGQDILGNVILYFGRSVNGKENSFQYDIKIGGMDKECKIRTAGSKVLCKILHKCRWVLWILATKDLSVLKVLADLVWKNTQSVVKEKWSDPVLGYFTLCHGLRSY